MQLSDCAIESGVHQIGSYLEQRNESIRPEWNIRVWYAQVFQSEHLIAEKEYIEIDYACAFHARRRIIHCSCTYAVHRRQPVLDVMADIQQLLCIQARLYRRHGIDEPFVIFDSHRFGLVKAGAFEHMNLADVLQELHGLLNVAEPVSLIGAKTDISSRLARIASYNSLFRHRVYPSPDKRLSMLLPCETDTLYPPQPSMHAS